MSIFEILLVGVGLSMDAAAVSMTDGMCYKLKVTQKLMIALAFGIFQGLMPWIGHLAGSLFIQQIQAFDHWIALILLGFIGGKMIWDGFRHDPTYPTRAFSPGMLITQAVATSMDALAVGLSFAAMNTNIGLSVSLIAVTTFLLSFLAVNLGAKIGNKLNTKAEISGGTILVLIGFKIFVEHMWL